MQVREMHLAEAGVIRLCLRSSLEGLEALKPNASESVFMKCSQDCTTTGKRRRKADKQAGAQGESPGAGSKTAVQKRERERPEPPGAQPNTNKGREGRGEARGAWYATSEENQECSI